MTASSSASRMRCMMTWRAVEAATPVDPEAQAPPESGPARRWHLAAASLLADARRAAQRRDEVHLPRRLTAGEIVAMATDRERTLYAGAAGQRDERIRAVLHDLFAFPHRVGDADGAPGGADRRDARPLLAEIVVRLPARPDPIAGQARQAHDESL